MPACLELEAGVPRRVGRPGVPRRARRPAARLRRAAVAADRVPPPVRASSGCGSCSSGRTSTTPARTRSTTCSARRCWPGAWARRGWWPRPAPASTAWPPPPPPRCSAWSASSTWARSTWTARPSTCSACGCSAPRCVPAVSGSRTLKDAVNEAMRDWVATVETTHYCLGSVMGPHPYPVDGPRVPPRHRRRGPGAVRRRCSTAPRPTSSSPASAAAPTRPASSPASSTPPAELVGVEPAGGAAIGRGRARRRARHEART